MYKKSDLKFGLMDFGKVKVMREGREEIMDGGGLANVNRWEWIEKCFFLCLKEQYRAIKRP